jgi:ABC-type sugar transport system ATPase subunit
MSTIRLQDVTKTYARPPALDSLVSARGLAGGQTDRAFAERAAAQSAQNRQACDGPVMALDHVNLTIPDGQTFAVVGPSGCGKSTLLRVVAGLETDFTGRVFYDDAGGTDAGGTDADGPSGDMADIPPKDRYIGMVFQNYALYPHFRGRGNLSFFFWVHNAPDEETEEHIRITSEMMGIGFRELLKRKPGALSGGQQQRVALARAIVRQPRLLLFDEPLSNLDAKLRAQTRVEIKRLLRRFQITTLYVTHDQTEAVALGDQIAVMCAGKIEQVGAYHDVLENPVNAFVAGFLGSPPMNLLDGGVVSDGELHLEGIAIPLPDAVQAHVRAGQAVTLGVRPEAACLVTGVEGPVPGGVRLRGVAEAIEPDFAHRTQWVYTRTGALFYAAVGPLDTSLNVGDEVEIVFHTDQLYFFDGESGRRIGSDR